MANTTQRRKRQERRGTGGGKASRELFRSRACFDAARQTHRPGVGFLAPLPNPKAGGDEAAADCDKR